ncbi:hypothetical protein [Streptomyces sp. NPDC058373]|uniref:hypothetical protein n=1 Tax=Streptomyces sp. NPDC058373 TaxID=3346465 RepID=UPI00365DF550
MAVSQALGRLHVLFRLETSEPFTPRDIWRDLQAEGIRSAKNSAELVGRDAVYAAFNRIIDARFLRRTSEGGGPGRLGRTRYELYRQPAYNPDTPPSEPWYPTEDIWPGSSIRSRWVGSNVVSRIREHP